MLSAVVRGGRRALRDLAGAAPYARFVLLDDAFPKIDTRTHPLLFGLLVDLDLDFVITSERLWSTHATVPELAIYEALRSPMDAGSPSTSIAGTVSACAVGAWPMRPRSPADVESPSGTDARPGGPTTG